MTKTPMCISHYDLNHFLQKEDLTVEDLTKEQLDEVLFFLGMDVSAYETETILHRPKYTPNNESWEGKRIFGWERQDKQWLFSRKSTIENVVNSNDDLAHKAELIRMSQQSNNTGYIVEQAERFKPEQVEVI